MLCFHHNPKADQMEEGMNQPEIENGSDRDELKSKSRPMIYRLLTWLVTIGCFYLVYGRIEEAAARDKLSSLEYLSRFFADASWGYWLILMIPYSLFFFTIDSHATWRVIRWYNAPSIGLRNILPIRASAYILSLVNEQVGKGAMSLYLLRRYEVPVWKALSSMIFLGMVEIYQLLFFSSLGVVIYLDLVRTASTALPLPTILGSVYLIAFLYFPFHILYFSGKIMPNSSFREKSLFHAFSKAKLTDYLLVLLFKAPNLIGAVIVYTLALDLFNVPVVFGQMLAFLPVIFLAAALPLPFHAGALLLWTVLFPNYPEVGVFSLIMHTFFVCFNALIGVVFLPKANRELFDSAR